MPRLACLTTLAVVLLAGLPAGAVPSGNLVRITDISLPHHAHDVTITLGALVLKDVVAGQIVLDAQYAGAIASPAIDVYAWCVDLFHPIDIGKNNLDYIVGGGTVVTDGQGNAVTPAISAELMTLAAYGNALLAGSDAHKADLSTAIQLAIWKTEYPTLSFTANSLVTADVARFQQIAASNTLSASLLLPQQDTQTLITDTISSNPPPVTSVATHQDNIPEPGAAAVLASALAGIAWLRRRPIFTRRK